MAPHTIDINGKTLRHSNDRQNFWAAVRAGKWEPETFAIFDKYICRGKTFIDIGAWNGVCSIYAAALGARVWSVEPDTAVWPELTENLRINNGLMIHAQVCVSDINGSRMLNSATPHGLGNSESSVIDRGHIGTEIRVNSETLEEFIQKRNIVIENICLIKMDVEGGEILIFKQAKNFLAKYRPTMYVSFHPAWFPDKENDIEMLIDSIFPTYSTVISVATGLEYGVADFFKAMHSAHDHSFILTV